MCVLSPGVCVLTRLPACSCVMQAYRSVTERRVDKFAAALEAAAKKKKKGLRAARQKVDPYPLLRFKVHFTVIHKGAKGKASSLDPSTDQLR